MAPIVENPLSGSSDGVSGHSFSARSRSSGNLSDSAHTCSSSENITESEYCSTDTSGLSSSSSYLSSEEEAKYSTFLSSMPGRKSRSSSLPSLPKGTEMNAMQVAVLLGQTRLNDNGDLLQKAPSYTLGKPSMPMCTSTSTVNLQETLKRHIQGQSMAAQHQIETKTGQNPEDFYKEILLQHGYRPRTFKHDEVEDCFFNLVSQERMASYSKDIIGAVVTGNINFLGAARDQGRRMDCCNRFGESIIHTACRRSQSSVVKFLIEDAQVDVRVRDDYGRTPCHDAAWTAEPNKEIIKLICTTCPDLLLIADKRGFTPLHYVRQSQWSAWIECLRENETEVLPKVLLKPQHEGASGA